jgi:hypothetical protein
MICTRACASNFRKSSYYNWQGRSPLRIIVPRFNRVFDVESDNLIKEPRLASRRGNMTAAKSSFFASQMKLRFDFLNKLLRSPTQLNG